MVVRNGIMKYHEEVDRGVRSKESFCGNKRPLHVVWTRALVDLSGCLDASGASAGVFKRPQGRRLAVKALCALGLSLRYGFLRCFYLCGEAVQHMRILVRILYHGISLAI